MPVDSPVNSESASIDVTLPPRLAAMGLCHPLSCTIDRATGIFATMGFSALDDFDVGGTSCDYYAPGVSPLSGARPPDTPVHSMLAYEPPIRSIASVRVHFGGDGEAGPRMVHHIEGVAVARDLTFAHLKGCLSGFSRMFSDRPLLPVRFCSGHAPCTEPRLDVYIDGTLGAGGLAGDAWSLTASGEMLNARVLAHSGIDPHQWQGFVFRIWVETLTLLRHGATEARDLVECDMRWLSHFGINPLTFSLSHEAG